MPEQEYQIKRRSLYDKLNEAGFTLPEYGEFDTRLNDPERRKNLYGKLSGSGFKLPEFNDFESRIVSREEVIPEPSKGSTFLENIKKPEFWNLVGNYFGIETKPKTEEKTALKENERPQTFAGESQFAVPEVVTTPETGGIKPAEQAPSIGSPESPEAIASAKMGNIANYLERSWIFNPVGAAVGGFVEGSKRGVEEYKKGLEKEGQKKYLESILQKATGIGEIALSSLNIIPATAPMMGAFGTTTQLIEGASPEAAKVIENTLNPFSKMLELAEQRGKKPEDWEKPSAKLLDILYQGMLFSVGHQTAKAIGAKIVAGESLAPKEMQIVKDAINRSGVKNSIEQTTKEKIAEKPTLEAKPIEQPTPPLPEEMSIKTPYLENVPEQLKTEETGKVSPEPVKTLPVTAEVAKPIPVEQVATSKEPLPEFKSSEEAIAYGRKNPDRLQELKARQEQYTAEGRKAQEAKDVNEAIRLATKSQLDREAFEFGSDPTRKFAGEELIQQKKIQTEGANKIAATRLKEMGRTESQIADALNLKPDEVTELLKPETTKGTLQAEVTSGKQPWEMTWSEYFKNKHPEETKSLEDFGKKNNYQSAGEISFEDELIKKGGKVISTEPILIKPSLEIGQEGKLNQLLNVDLTGRLYKVKYKFEGKIKQAYLREGREGIDSFSNEWFISDKNLTHNEILDHFERLRKAEKNLVDRVIKIPKYDLIAKHKSTIEQAIKEGKPVPLEVLKDYPDLQKQVPEQKPIVKGKALTGEMGKGVKAEVPTSLTPEGKEVVKASQIIETASKELNLPIRTGRVRWGKRTGIFKVQPEVARLKEANDLSTFTHEIAHFIDKKALKSAGSQRFAKWKKELADLDYDQTKRRTNEGFAEFVRHYMTMDDAQQVAPKFYDYFTKDFLPNNPKFAQTIESSRIAITKWRQQGSLARVLSQIDFEGETGKTTIGEKLTTARLKMQATWIDRLAPIKYAVNQILKSAGVEKIRPSEDPYQIAVSIQKASSAKAREFVMNGAFDFQLNKVGKSLKEVVEPISKDHENALAYAYAKHGKSLHERGINPGISLEDANYVLENYAKPEYEQFSKDFTEWSSYLVNYLVDAGGLSKEIATRMREVNPFYIMLKRAFAEEGVSAPKGKGFVDLPSPIKRIKGSGREIVNPLESMVAQTEQIIAVADKARVARALADMSERFEGTAKWIEKVPAPIEAKMVELNNIKKQIESIGGDLSQADMESMITIFTQGKGYYGKDNIVSIFRNGKREYFQLHPMLYDAMKGLDKTTLPWFIDMTFGKATRAVRLGATGIRAGFTLITNPIRDAQTFMLQSEHAGVRPDKIAKAIYHELGGTSKYAREFRRAGGEMSQPLGLDRKMLQNTVNEILTNEIKYKALNIVKHPIEALREVLSFPESGTRLTEFESVMKKYSPLFEQAKSKGDLVELKKLQEDAAIEASNAASEVTVNFKRAGTYSAVLNQLVPFFNPAIQGVSKMGRTIYEHPVRSGLRATAILTAPTLALWYVNKDEEWYKNLPVWQKYAFWNFKVGDKIIRLPKPFEWGYIFSGIPEGIANSIYQKDPESFKDALAQTLTVAPDFMPALVKPAVETYFNWDMFRERPVVSKAQEGLLPEQQYTPYTSGVAKEAGKILGVSPSKIDHLLNGYTGGLASDILNALPKEYREASDLPIVGRLFTRESTVGYSGENVKKFYESYQRMQSIDRTIQNAKKFDREVNISGEDEKYIAAKGELQVVSKSLSMLRQKQGEINKMNLDSDIKKKLNQAIEQSAARLAGLSIEQFKHTTNQKEFESLSYKDAADEWSKMSESSKISVANQMMTKLEVAGRTEKIPDSELSKYQKIYQEAEKLSNIYEKEGEERLNKMQGILNKTETEVMNFTQ